MDQKIPNENTKLFKNSTEKMDIGEDDSLGPPRQPTKNEENPGDCKHHASKITGQSESSQKDQGYGSMECSSNGQSNRR